MIPILIVLLIITAVVMLLKNNSTVAIICVVLSLLLAILRPFLTSSNVDLSKQFQAKSMQVMTDVLVERIVARHPDKKITIITAPEFEGMPEVLKRKNPKQTFLQKAFEKRGVSVEISPLPLAEGVKNRLGQLGGSSESESEVNMAYDTQMMQIILNFNTGDLNKTLRELNGKTDMAILCVDISSEIFADRLLPKGEGPELVLMHVTVDDVETAMESTVLDTLLRYQPSPAWGLEYSWPKNDAEAFDDQFIFATRENPVLP